MDISEYFEVVSTSDRVFHFRLKGFWSEELMAEMNDDFIAAFCAGVDAMDGQPFLVLGDTTLFKPPSSSAKANMGKTMKYAKDHGLYKTVEVMPSAITKLAVRQAAAQSGKDDFRIVVSSVEEAWEKINELKHQL